MRNHKTILTVAVAIIFIILPAPSLAGQKCIECDSKTDANCITDLSKFTAKDCDSKCFVKIDASGDITRGCDPSTDCTNPGCYSCQTDECNKHNICKSCDSSKTPNCATKDGTGNTNEICPAPDTKCIKKVNTNMQLERHCATKDEETACTDSETCNVCVGANCNTGIFPISRRRCYQCNGDSQCANLEGLESTPCLLYKAKDECYTYGTSASAMTRGCVSDSDSAVNKCQTDKADKSCLTCDKDNCNYFKYKRDQQLKCFQCTSTKDDKKCAWGQTDGASTNCKTQIVYNDPESCYTHVDKDGIVDRGCLGDRETTAAACTADNNCNVCSSADGCNNQNESGFQCVRCRSDEDTNCRNAADKSKLSSCTKPVVQSTAKCFHGIWNDVVIRGCLVDGDSRLQASCAETNNAHQCTICDESGCNKKNTDNGAASISISIGLIAIVSIALLRLN